FSATNGLTKGGTKVEGSGTMETKTGKIKLKFTGVKETTFNTECHSPGLAAGVVETTELVYHNIYLTDNKTTPGIKITANVNAAGEQHFATFICLGVTNVVRGHSIVGDLESPACGASSNEYKVDFQQTG